MAKHIVILQAGLICALALAGPEPLPPEPRAPVEPTQSRGITHQQFLETAWMELRVWKRTIKDLKVKARRERSSDERKKLLALARTLEEDARELSDRLKQGRTREVRQNWGDFQQRVLAYLGVMREKYHQSGQRMLAD